MSQRRFLTLLAAAMLVILGAFYLSSQRSLPRDNAGTALLPPLAAELGSLSTVSLTRGAAAPSVTLHKVADRWVVAQRGDYPADIVKLRKLMLALSESKIIEEKTSDPANYATLGVDDPTKPGAGGTRVDWRAADGLHQLIVGKPQGGGTFVRRLPDARSYLVAPALSVDAEARFWLDSRLLDRPSAGIQRIELKPADGPSYALRRASPKEASYELDGVPAGRKALEPAAIAPSSTLLSGLSIEDVTAAADIDFSHASVATIEFSDGDRITLTGAVVGGKHWLQVQATRDAALTAQARGRAFEVAAYRYEEIFRPLEQLLIPKPAPTPKPAAASKPTAAPKPTAAAPRP